MTRSMGIGVVVCALLTGGGAGWKLGRPVRVKAQSGCSVGNFQGSFGNQYSGFVSLGGAAVPIADVGHVTADGNGNYTSADTFSINAILFRTTQTGTYTVNPDCTGSSVGKDNLGNVIQSDFVIVNGGAQVQAVYTQPGITVSTVLTRQ